MHDLETLRRRAAQETGSILLESARSAGARTLFFSDPVEWFEIWSLEKLPKMFALLERGRRRGLWAAGYLAYECGPHWEPRAAQGRDDASSTADGLPLAVFGLYPEPKQAGDLPTEMSGASSLLEPPHMQLDADAFAAKVEQIRQWIEAGDTYQVNLTDRLQARCDGDAAALFARMMSAQPVDYGALLRLRDRTILSASPELFFRLDGSSGPARSITVRPMKGTAPRGRDRSEDESARPALAADPKNRAENLMIVDLMRNDLGRIAETGSVRVEQLFQVETFPSLLQMTSTVRATLRQDVALYDVFGALFPCGSIVGAPKVRTMQIIRELEGRPRGVYTGTIGYQAPDGDAVFSVAIRTAVLHGNALEMGVGAGITHDSNAQAEYAECLLKGAFLSAGPFRLIETLRAEHGAIALLPLHLDRMQDSALYFGFAFDRDAIAAQLAAQAVACDTGAWKLRCELDRHGRLHLDPPEALAPSDTPLRLLLWPARVDSGDRFLRHKTTRRAFYAHALAEARAQGFDEAIFLNERDQLTEGTIHNLVLQRGDAWLTPPLDAGVLPGVYRRHLFATLPGLREATLRLEDLQGADTVWVTNAVRGKRAAHLAVAPPR